MKVILEQHFIFIDRSGTKQTISVLSREVELLHFPTEKMKLLLDNGQSFIIDEVGQKETVGTIIAFGYGYINCFDTINIEDEINDYNEKGWLVDYKIDILPIPNGSNGTTLNEEPNKPGKKSNLKWDWKKIQNDIEKP